MNDEPSREPRDERGAVAYADEFRDDEEIPTNPPCRVTRKLGRGGHAVTYEITNDIGKSLAIKVLHSNLSQQAEHVVRLMEEAKKLAKLTHPNIVEVYSAGVTSGPRPRAFILMQLLNGRSLRYLPRRDGRLSPKVAVDLLKQICSALVAAHAKGIIHQDLKLENVVAHKDEHSTKYVMKLVDFGVARFIGEATRDNLFEGTPEAAAPEQISGSEPITIKVDLYALGVIAFELLTGRRPYYEAEQRDKEQARIDALNRKERDALVSHLITDKLTKDAPRLSHVLDAIFEQKAAAATTRGEAFNETYAPIPLRLEDLVVSLLARRSVNRPASAATVLETLVAISESLEDDQSSGTTQDALRRIEEPSPPPQDLAEPIRSGRSIRVQHNRSLQPAPHPINGAPLAAVDRNATVDITPVGIDGNRTVRLSMAPARASAPPAGPSLPAVVVTASQKEEEPPKRPSTPPHSDIPQSAMLPTVETRRPDLTSVASRESLGSAEQSPNPVPRPVEGAPRNTLRFGASPIEGEPTASEQNHAPGAAETSRSARPWVEDDRARFERIPPLDLAFDLFMLQADDLYVAENTGIPLERVLFLGEWFRTTFERWLEVQKMSREQLLEHCRRTKKGRLLAYDLLATEATVLGIADLGKIPPEEAEHLAQWFADLRRRAEEHQHLSLDDVVARYHEPTKTAPPVEVADKHVDDLLHSYAGPSDARVHTGARPASSNDANPSRAQHPPSDSYETVAEEPGDIVMLPRSELQNVLSWPVWKLTALFTLILSLPLVLTYRWWSVRLATPIAVPVTASSAPLPEPLPQRAPTTIPAPVLAEVTPSPPNVLAEAPTVEQVQPQPKQRPEKRGSTPRKLSPPHSADLMTDDLGDDDGRVTPSPKATKPATAPSAPSVEDKLYGLILKKMAVPASDAGSNQLLPPARSL